MQSAYQLFLANLKIFYRNSQGFYWTILMPSIIYIALSVLPIGAFLTKGIDYPSFLLPGIVAMSIMQTGIYGLAYWMVDLKSQGIIKRFLVTPIRSVDIILGIVSSRIIVVLVEVLSLTLVGVIFFNARFAGNFFSIFIISILGAGIFLLAGLLISNYAKTYDTAAPVTSAIGLPLTFLGNIFFPIDSLPHILKIVAKILPTTYLADGLRQSYLYAFDFQKISKDILILAVWLVFMSGLTVWLFKLKED